MDLAEIKELTEHISTLKIESEDDYRDAVEALKSGMDARDKTAAEVEQATAALKAQLAELAAPFAEPADAANELVTAAKAAIVRLIEREESDRLAAVKARKPVPAPLARPKGVSVKQALQLVAAAPEKLDDEYLSVIPDADKILAAVEAGVEFDAAVVKTQVETKVSYRRPK